MCRAALADGGDLPDWLSFDPDSRVLSGVPGNADVGVHDLRITVTDPEGESVSELFTLTVENVNDTPVVVAPLADEEIDEDVPCSLAIPEGTFTDPDLIHGDKLTLGAMLVGGDPLPAWLVFDPATRTLSGTAENADVGEYAIEIKATDLVGASATTSFQLTINNVNDTPIVAHQIEDATAYIKESFEYRLPKDRFTDPDLIHGDTLALERYSSEWRPVA
ncbi:MAG: putative Ig domain-containing protein [Gammaproteobacteria bacterium]|nr:putative Ig domain-containing protein [Gammaproteobacteria bacterium]